jgi:hypothetical protein
MWLRLAILVIVFTEPVRDVFDPTIRNLVVYAIQGIEDASVPKIRYYQTQALVHRETRQLQKSLIGHFDRDRNGRLSAAEQRQLRKLTGLSAAEVTQRGPRADQRMSALLKANQSLDLMEPGRTARDIRRAAAAAGQAEMERAYESARHEIEPMLAMQYPGWRDYLHWRTWRRGLDWSVGTVMYNIEQATALDERMLRCLGLPVLLVVLVVSVRRFGKAEALQKRFQEDAAFATVACSICKQATGDFGALPYHRVSRALAAGAVVVLALWAVAAVSFGEETRRSPFLAIITIIGGGGEWGGSFSPLMMLSIGALVAVVRWVVWPFEVHACHRHPKLLIVGFAASVVAVVVPACWIGVFSLNAFMP